MKRVYYEKKFLILFLLISFIFFTSCALLLDRLNIALQTEKETRTSNPFLGTWRGTHPTENFLIQYTFYFNMSWKSEMLGLSAFGTYWYDNKKLYATYKGKTSVKYYWFSGLNELHLSDGAVELVLYR